MSSNQEFENFVPVFDTAPKEPEKLRQFLVEQLRRISNSVNQREIGQYFDIEVLSGKQFFPGASVPEQNRQIFRKVVTFGALPNSTGKSVAHEITTPDGSPLDSNFTLIHLYGAATNPTSVTAIPLPFASPTATEEIKLSMDDTNIIVTTAMDYTAYTRTFIVVEYIQEL